MLHSNRVHCVKSVPSTVDLAQNLSGPEAMSWCSCTGIRCGRLLLLCDQTSPDGAGEWAAFLLPAEGTASGENLDSWLAGASLDVPLQQIESITFSWIETWQEALRVIQRLIAGTQSCAMGTHLAKLEGPEWHRCEHCM